MSPEEFKAVLGRFATGVTVVTTCDGARRAGITVNAFASLSLDPPLVLVCIERASHIHDLMARVGFFAVNLLTDAQRPLSEGFAAKTEFRYEHFCDATSHTAVTGAPILEGILGFVDCRTVDIFPGGDHSIFVGRIEALGAGEDAPLLYYRGHYLHLEEGQP